jgi:bifunctional DNase/RNase
VFYSYLICKNGIDEEQIDSRTSDALALAVRFDCSIFVNENILEEAGVEADPADSLTETDVDKELAELTSPESKGSSYEGMTVEELQLQMQKALDDEDYELAARIRDELKQRG